MLLIVLVSDSIQLIVRMVIGMPISDIEKLIYQLEVKVTRSPSRFIQDQPLWLKLSSFARLSAIMSRVKRRSLPYWYLFIDLFFSWINCVH